MLALLILGGFFELCTLGLLFYGVQAIKPETLKFKARLGDVFELETELRLRDSHSLPEGRRIEM